MTIQPVTLRRPIKHHSNTADHLIITSEKYPSCRRRIFSIPALFLLVKTWKKYCNNCLLHFFRSKGEWQDGEGGGGGGGGGRYGTNEAAKEILSRISDCLWVRYPTLPQHSFPIPSTPACFIDHMNSFTCETNPRWKQVVLTLYKAVSCFSPYNHSAKQFETLNLLCGHRC